MVHCKNKLVSDDEVYKTFFPYFADDRQSLTHSD